MLRVFWDAALQVDPRAQKADEKHMPLCRAGELSALWKQGGLEDVREQPLEIVTRFDSFADYWEAFLLGQGPAGAFVKNLTADQRQTLRDELIRRVAPQGEREPFSLPARAWAVRGIVPAR